MKTLVDTNILTRLAHPNDPQHAVTVQATDALLQAGDDLLIVAQNHYEFWVVATRPTAVNGLGLTATEVAFHIAQHRKSFSFLDETPQVYSEWFLLVTSQTITGKAAHDAHLVAAMLVHGIPRIFTLNTKDFTRHTSIQAVSPYDVLQIPSP